VRISTRIAGVLGLTTWILAAPIFPSWAAAQPPPSCGPGAGLSLLPATHPPAVIFAGFDVDPTHIQMLRLLVELSAELDPPPELVILLPRTGFQGALGVLRGHRQTARGAAVRFLPTGAEETIWVQDFFEPAVELRTGEVSLLDLPYPFSGVEELPIALAMNRGWTYRALSATPEDVHPNLAGSFGGNIEALPGGLAMAGDSMGLATRRSLDATISQTVLTVKTRWLSTGHVDEIMTVVPRPQHAGGCDFALAHASPALAMELLADPQGRQVTPLESLTGAGIEDRQTLWNQDLVLRCIEAHRNGTSKAGLLPFERSMCSDLERANRRYESLIQGEVRRIGDALSRRVNCGEIPRVPLPQLFAPEVLQDQYGGPTDHARALNPNLVNLISLGPMVVLPTQPNQAFEEAARDALTALGLSVRFADPGAVHHLGGGLHCTTNIVRACRPQPTDGPTGAPP
jgi:hypothetical protein